MPAEKRQKLLKKLIYKSNYMGYKENDFVFGKFAKNCLNSLEDKDLILYEELLALDDATLYNLVSSCKPAPEKFANLIKKIIENAKII